MFLIYSDGKQAEIGRVGQVKPVSLIAGYVKGAAKAARAAHLHEKKLAWAMKVFMR